MLAGGTLRECWFLMAMLLLAVYSVAYVLAGYLLARHHLAARLCESIWR